MNSSITRLVPREPPRLWHSLWRERISLAGTYSLFTLENVLALLEPMLLGAAITGALHGSYRETGWFVGFAIIHVVASGARRMFDTRTYCRIYSALVSEMVVRQRAQSVSVSQVTARSRLAYELIEFLERDLPMAFSSCLTMFGAVIALCTYDAWLVIVLAVLSSVGLCVNFYLGGYAAAVHRKLNDELENEVAVIESGDQQQTRSHYQKMVRWRIVSSDLQVGAYGSMQVVTYGLFAVTLVLASRWTGANPGELYAVMRYVLMFSMGATVIPQLLPQLARLRDIHRRLAAEVINVADG